MTGTNLTKPKRKKLFKGLLRRKSKKSIPQSTITNRIDDEASVYSVAIDANSKVSSASSTLETVKTPLGDPVHVILLLMDSKTRRFELLQLEFDSNSAKVDDVFNQIPISATEPSLRNEKFDYLCNLKGEELKKGFDIAEYIETAGIVVAVPTSSDEKPSVIAKMATPILSNPKVHKMLSSSGLKISDLPEPVVKKNPPTPILEPPPIVSRPVTIPPKKETEVETKNPTNYFAVGAIFAVVFHLILKINVHYTSPLGPGDFLSPGRARGACGLSSFSPSTECESLSASMGEDGIFSVLQGDEIVYSLSGKACSNDESGCIDGLSIDVDGKISIGGSKVKTITKSKISLQPFPFTDDVTIPRTLI